MHRVFSSNHKIRESSRQFQFYRINIGDSEEIVMSFMQVGTYPTKNFATFEPL